MIPRHVNVIILRVFYVLNMITTGRKIGILWRLLLFVSLVSSKDKTLQASLAKLTA